MNDIGSGNEDEKFVWIVDGEAPTVARREEIVQESAMRVPACAEKASQNLWRCPAAGGAAVLLEHGGAECGWSADLETCCGYARMNGAPNANGTCKYLYSRNESERVAKRVRKRKKMICAVWF